MSQVYEPRVLLTPAARLLVGIVLRKGGIVVRTCDDWAELEGAGSGSLEESKSDGAGHICRLPKNIQRRAGGKSLILGRGSHGIETSSLGDDGRNEGQDGRRDERRTHGEEDEGLTCKGLNE